jgi:peptidoglycan biosynthesis protein MviN/MurJ (putative lipid II flippase)
MPIALVHCCLLANATLLQNYFWCIEKGRIVGFILAIGLMVNVGLNAWWVPLYGLAGAMTATAISGVCIQMLTWWALYCHGVGMDRASFLLSLLPIVLLLGAIPSMCVAAVLLVLSSRTSCILGREEKRRIDDAIAPQLQRLGLPIRTLWHIG